MDVYYRFRQENPESMGSVIRAVVTDGKVSSLEDKSGSSAVLSFTHKEGNIFTVSAPQGRYSAVPFASGTFFNKTRTRTYEVDFSPNHPQVRNDREDTVGFIEKISAEEAKKLCDDAEAFSMMRDYVC